MDFKEKMMQAQALKAETVNVVTDIQNQINAHDEKVRIENLNKLNESLGIAPKKNFDIQKKLRELKNRQEEDDQKMILDPQTVKVVKVYKDLTEMELLDIMGKFGEVSRVKIPFDDNGGYRGIAFATFKNPEDAQKVIAEGYIKYDFYELPVEQATMSLRQRERNEQQ